MEKNSLPSSSPFIVLYAIYSFILAVLYVISSKESGFFINLFIFVFSLIGAFLGTIIGDFLRKIAMPDSFYTTGGMSAILKEKLFWFIGPQAIGGIFGGAVGLTIVTTIAG